MKVSHDAANDVLYVRREGAAIHRSRTCLHDDWVILGCDAEGAVVGATVTGASELSPPVWESALYRNAMPSDVWDAVHAWLAARGAATGAGG